MTNRRKFQRRRLNQEALESRRLLAANCAVEEAPMDALVVSESALVSAPLAEAAGVTAEGESLIATTSLPAPYLDPTFGPDFVQEVGDKLFAVDQDYFSQTTGLLVIFERTDDGSLELVSEHEVGFSVQDLIVTEEQVVVLGNDYGWLAAANSDAADLTLGFPSIPGGQTNVLTINLNVEPGEAEEVRQEFEGTYHELHQDGDQLLMVSTSQSDIVIAIFPPPEITGTARAFQITNEGLQVTASGAIPAYGFNDTHNGDIFTGKTTYHDIVFLLPPGVEEIDPNATGIRAPDEPYPIPVPTVAITQHGVRADANSDDEAAIVEVNRLDLGEGYLSDFQVAEDGLSALALVTEYGNGVGPASLLHLIDLSGDEMRIFESIRLEDFNGQVLGGNADQVLLRNYNSQALLVVDINQSLDLAAENRIRTIEIPDSLVLGYPHLQVNEDRIVIWADRISDGDQLFPLDFVDAPFFPNFARESVLLTVSLAEAELIGDANLDSHGWQRHLVLIDGESQRIGYISDHGIALDALPEFVYGHLNDDGEFESDGAIGTEGQWLEIDANADRLVVRQFDRLVEYDWDNPNEPTVTPLGEPLPEIEAVNDSYTLFAGEDHFLDVLANDQIHHFGFAPVAQIVELVGAPEGAEIIGGHSVRIPAAALEGVESVRFEYVISDGTSTSSAVVEIEVESINEGEVEALILAVREQAAEDFGVEVEDVTVTSVERVFGEPLPVVLPDGTELDLSPGILVILEAPNATALYAASLDGQIIQVFASVRDFLVELGLNAVDANGVALDQVSPGDEFWLEFNAKDLRDFGLGVYAAFIDLELPPDLLEFTGEIEYADGYTGVAGNIVGPHFLDDVGAISEDIDPPGNSLQQILRVGVRALAPGEANLRPEPAGAPGTEALLRGRQTEVPEDRVRYSSLTLEITEGVEGNPLDSNGDGVVTAVDALVVINFLSQYGTTDLSQLAARVRAVSGEGEMIGDIDLDVMRRYDTNRSGTISALDALVVVNNINENLLVTDMEGEDDSDDELLNQGPSLLF